MTDDGWLHGIKRIIFSLQLNRQHGLECSKPCVWDNTQTFTLSLACAHVNVLYIVIYLQRTIIQFFFFRSWRNHIKSCAPENQVKIYQTLCILLEELSMDKFNELDRSVCSVLDERGTDIH